MPLQELYNSLSAPIYYALFSIFSFLLGVILGWLLWYWKTRQEQTVTQRWRTAKDEHARLNQETQQLKTEWERRQEQQRSQSESSSLLSSSLLGDASATEIDRLAAQPLAFADSGSTGSGSADGSVTDWSSIDGVDASLAAELKQMGVQNAGQLDGLSAEQRKVFEAKLRSRGHQWDWTSLANWKSGVGIAGFAAGAAGAWQSVKPDSQQSGTEQSDAEKPGAQKSGTQGTGQSSSSPTSGQAVGGMGASGAIDQTAARFADVDGPSVNWSEVEGIDPKVASELEGLGVKNLEQLESLSPQDREWFESRMSASGSSWDWSSLANWKTALAGGAAAAGLYGATRGSGGDTSETNGGSSDVASSASSGLQGSGAHGSTTPGASGSAGLVGGATSSSGPAAVAGAGAAATSPAGASSGLVAGFQASRFTGTGWYATSALGRTGTLQPPVHQGKRFPPAELPQLESHHDSNAQHGSSDSVTGAASTADASSDASSAEVASTGVGTSANAWTPTHANVQRDTESGFSGIAARPITVPPAKGDSVNWSNLAAVQPGLATEFEALGIANVEQLEGLSAEDRRTLESRLEQKGLQMNWSWLQDWKTAAGVAAAGAAGVAGVAAASATTSASDHATKEGQQWGENRITGFASPASIGDTRSAQSLAADATPGGDATSGGDASDGASATASARLVRDNQLPVFFQTKPSVKDDLTLLDGIDGPQAIELHRMGIHNFEQLHDMSADNRLRLQNWFRKRGWYLDMDQWRIASEGNTLNPSIEDIQKKAFEIYQFRDRHGLCGGERTDWEQAEWELRGNPSFGYGVPHDVDDFAVSVTGITPEARDELYRMGLYNSHQVQGCDHEGRRLLTRWFAGPRFGVDLTSAFGWLSTLRSVPQDRDYGHVFTSRPKHIDDLSDIAGVGPATERDLNRIGIYQFSQLIAWSPENIQAISDTLDLGDRITSDDWVGQARALKA